MRMQFPPVIFAALEPGDRVNLLPAEDGEILPGGDYVIAEIGHGDGTLRFAGHPRVSVHSHRIAAVYLDRPVTFRAVVGGHG